MDYKQFGHKHIRCLECGEEIQYGRTDKKYCSDTCRHHHNNKKSTSRAYMGRIQRSLSRNYQILSSLLEEGRTSVSLLELDVLGYKRSLVTGYIKNNKHVELSCFDITFIQTDSKIYRLSKTSAR